MVKLDAKQFALLELFQSAMAKQAQGLPENCSNTLRRKGIVAHCKVLSILFLWQLLLLPFESLYKKRYV